VVRIRPPCRVDEEEAGDDCRAPEACVNKTAANTVAIQGQDFTFDAVADEVSTQVRRGDILGASLGLGRDFSALIVCGLVVDLGFAQ
jgi:kinesin family member 15